MYSFPSMSQSRHPLPRSMYFGIVSSKKGYGRFALVCVPHGISRRAFWKSSSPGFMAEMRLGFYHDLRQIGRCVNRDINGMPVMRPLHRPPICRRLNMQRSMLFPRLLRGTHRKDEVVQRAAGLYFRIRVYPVLRGKIKRTGAHKERTAAVRRRAQCHTRPRNFKPGGLGTGGPFSVVVIHLEAKLNSERDPRQADVISQEEHVGLDEHKRP